MTVELSEADIEKTLHGITIPPRPQIVVDLQVEQVMPDPDRATIAKLIGQDAALAGAVLKTVNSPLFGLQKSVSSIQHAVSLMGISSVINLVTALAMRQSLKDEEVTVMNRFWDTATDIAKACTLVANELNFEPVDEAYALGLFHNCGIPLMMIRYQNYCEVLEQAYAAEEQRIVDVENERFKTNHAVLGYYTAKSWKLPAHISDAIATHHNLVQIFADGKAEDNPTNTLLAILKIASHLCGAFHMIGGQNVDHEWEAVQPALLAYTGLVEDDIQNLNDSCVEMGIAHA